MNDTKERILHIALHLFARDGYEAVSVSTIAGELGITKGALYRHYQNKQAIFDSIVERMVQIDAQRSQEFSVPQEKLCDSPEGYDTVSVEAVRAFTLAQFSFWTQDAFASDFRWMLTLEQYRNEEMAALHSQCFTVGPVAYMADIFRKMQERNILRTGDCRLLAVEYYAPMYLLMDQPDSAQGSALLAQHIDRFMLCHAAGPGGKNERPV